MEDKDKQGEKKWYILDRGSLSLLIVLLAAILFYVGLTNFDVIAVRVRTFMGVLTPFIAGFAIAYLLNTPMCFFERKLYQKQKHRRGLAILTVYLIALAIVVVLLNLIIPQVAQSVVDLATNMQTYLTSLNSLVQTLSEQFGLEAEALNEAIGSYQDLMTNIAAYLSKALPDLLNFGYAIGSGVISGITALISSVYMLAGKGRLVPQIKKMLYAILPRRRADWLLGVCGHANRVFGLYQWQADRLGHHRCALLYPLLDFPHPISHAGQRRGGRHQHYPLFWTDHRRHPLSDDSGDRRPLGGPAVLCLGHRPSAV